MSKTTLEDIAKITGYSKTVISRVLNGKAGDFRISATTAEAIMKVCEDLHYHPNVIAQNLRNQNSKTIGLIVPYVNYSFFGNLSTNIILEAYKNNFTVSLAASMENAELEKKAIETMLARNIDGIIISPCSQDATLLKKTAEQVPLIQIDRYFETDGLSYISTNNYEGARTAMRLLFERGHRRIHCIQGVLSAMPTRERVRGVLDAAREAGLSDSVTVSGNDYSIQNGYLETMIALTSPQPPTAIFALNNSIMLGVIQALREVGKTIPDDLSLITFDDNQYLDYMAPPVTRIAQPVDNICMAAVKLLLQSIKAKTPADCHLLMSPVTIMRDSIKIC